jgi:type II secretory pathway pseudopilin PulG
MSLQHYHGRGKRGDCGYAMVALLVSLGIMSVLMGAALPVWRQAAKREKEAELAWRGEQYARAIGLFQRKYGGAFPPNLDVLVDQKFLRRKYKDPMTRDGDFQILFQGAQAAQRPGQPTGAVVQAGETQNEAPAAASQPVGGTSRGALGAQGGIVGVTSKSKEQSVRLYKGRGRYNEWQFVYVPVTTQGGAGAGAATPGLPGRQGQPRPGLPPGRGGPPNGGPGRPPGVPPRNDTPQRPPL